MDTHTHSTRTRNSPAPASGDNLRIAMLAPPWIPVPPRAYGGIESVEAERSPPKRPPRLGTRLGTSQVVPYLNRLADLVYTLARWQEGAWRPLHERNP